MQTHNIFKEYEQNLLAFFILYYFLTKPSTGNAAQLHDGGDINENGGSDPRLRGAKRSSDPLGPNLLQSFQRILYKFNF